MRRFVPGSSVPENVVARVLHTAHAAPMDPAAVSCAIFEPLPMARPLPEFVSENGWRD
jgi:hypothetical protein